MYSVRLRLLTDNTPAGKLPPAGKGTSNPVVGWTSLAGRRSRNGVAHLQLDAFIRSKHGIWQDLEAVPVRAGIICAWVFPAGTAPLVCMIAAWNALLLPQLHRREVLQQHHTRCWL